QRADAVGDRALARLLGIERGSAALTAVAVDTGRPTTQGRRLDGKQGYDWRVGAFENGDEPRHLGDDVDHALAQERVLDGQGGLGRLRVALHRRDLAL